MYCAMVPRRWTEYQVLSPKLTVMMTTMTTMTMKQHQQQQQQQLRRQPLLRRRRTTTTVTSSIATRRGGGGGMTMASRRHFSMMMVMAMMMALAKLLCSPEFPTCDAFQPQPASQSRRRPPPATTMTKTMNTIPYKGRERGIGRRKEASSSRFVVLHLSSKRRSNGQPNNEDGGEEEEEGKDDDSSFIQRPGENDIDFIKRITMESEQRLKKATKKNMNTNTNTKEGDGDDEQQQQDNPRTKKQTGTYQRIEEWDEERRKRSKGGELTWEERVQFDGQRFGDQVRQQSILEKHIGTFWRK